MLEICCIVLGQGTIECEKFKCQVNYNVLIKSAFISSDISCVKSLCESADLIQ